MDRRGRTGKTGKTGKTGRTGRTGKTGRAGGTLELAESRFRTSTYVQMSDTLTILATFGWCLLSGIIPVVNAELYLLSASALVSPSLVLPVIIAATLGQMI